VSSNLIPSATSVPEWALRLRRVRYERLEQPGLRSHDPNLTFRDLDALSERAQMVAVKQNGL